MVRTNNNTTFTFYFLGGRRGDITLGHILRFVTGSEREPVLGFRMHPSLSFVVTGPSQFLPTSNTCINKLNLARATISYSLPNEVELFKLFDYGFSNEYFGQI